MDRDMHSFSAMTLTDRRDMAAFTLGPDVRSTGLLKLWLINPVKRSLYLLWIIEQN